MEVDLKKLQVRRLRTALGRHAQGRTGRVGFCCMATGSYSDPGQRCRQARPFRMCECLASTLVQCRMHGISQPLQPALILPVQQGGRGGEPGGAAAGAGGWHARAAGGGGGAAGADAGKVYRNSCLQQPGASARLENPGRALAAAANLRPAPLPTQSPQNEARLLRDEVHRVTLELQVRKDDWNISGVGGVLRRERHPGLHCRVAWCACPTHWHVCCRRRRNGGTPSVRAPAAGAPAGTVQAAEEARGAGVQGARPGWWVLLPMRQPWDMEHPSQQPWLLHVPLLSQYVVQPDLFGLPHAGEEAHSQAYYIIKAAQERQELTEQVGSCVAAQPEARRGSSPAVSFMDSCSSCALLSFRLRVATHWTLHSALPLLDCCAVHLFQL